MDDAGRLEGRGRRELDPREADAVIAVLADRDAGVVEHAELVDAGLTVDQVRRRVERQLLRPHHRGVYLVGHRNPAPRALLHAALKAVPGAALAGLTAATRHGTAHHTGRIELVTAKRSGVERPGLALHRCASLRAEDVMEVDGLRCTTPQRTCLDVAAWHPRSLPRVLNESERLLLHTGDLRGRIAGRPGAGAMRAALDHLQPGGHDVRSPPEWELLRALAAVRGLPAPAANVVVEGYEVDLLWTERRLVVMVDGAQDHLRHSRFDRDRRMDNDLPALRYRVLRYPSWRIARDLPAVVAEIAGAWQARGPWAS